MRKWVGIIFCIFFVGICQSIFAETRMVCQPVKVKLQNHNIILLGPSIPNTALVYFFKNAGNEGIWIDHPSGKRMNAGWSSYLRSGNWSAFLLNRKDFVITCSAIRPGHVEMLDCIKSLSLCSPKQVEFKVPPKATYWLVEDKSWDEVVKLTEKRGITLK